MRSEPRQVKCFPVSSYHFQLKSVNTYCHKRDPSVVHQTKNKICFFSITSPSHPFFILCLSFFLSFFLSFSLSFSFFLSLSIKNLLLSFYLLYPYDCLFAVSLLLLTTFTYLSFSIYFFLPVTLSLCIYFHLSTLPLFSSLSSSLLYLPTYLSTYVRTYQPTYLPTTFDLSNSSIFMYSLSFLTQHFSLCLCSCLCRYHLLQCGFLRPLRRRFDVFFI